MFWTSLVCLHEPVIQANGRLTFEDDLRPGSMLCYTVNQRPHWACRQYGHSGGTRGWLGVERCQFLLFFGRFEDTKCPFKICWPLAITFTLLSCSVQQIQQLILKLQIPIWPTLIIYDFLLLPEWCIFKISFLWSLNFNFDGRGELICRSKIWNPIIVISQAHKDRLWVHPPSTRGNSIICRMRVYRRLPVNQVCCVYLDSTGCVILWCEN